MVSVKDASGEAMTRCTCRPRDQCESCFAAQIRTWAELNGWLCHRMPTWRPTCSSPGFPDMVLAGHGRLILAELKRDKGYLSPSQGDWAIELVLAPCEYYCWRPQDWSDIENRLRRPDRGPRLESRAL